MNKTRIEYGTHAWNPVQGCQHGSNICATASTCWARAMATRFGRDFKPSFHHELLQQPFGLRHPETSRILVCFTGDLGGAWVPLSWQQAVVNVIRQCHAPQFLLLSKNPNWYAQFNPWPDNAWVGMSITGAETPERQIAMFNALRQVDCAVRWLSYEPMLGAIHIPDWLDWVVMGAQSGRGAVVPTQDWLRGLHAITPWPYWEKNNLAKYLKRPLRQEMP